MRKKNYKLNSVKKKLTKELDMPYLPVRPSSSSVRDIKKARRINN